jgi:hypothetical protein
VKYNFDLSPNLSPKRREALNCSPFPLREGGKGVRSICIPVPHGIENDYRFNFIFVQDKTSVIVLKF